MITEARRRAAEEQDTPRRDGEEDEARRHELVQFAALVGRKKPALRIPIPAMKVISQVYASTIRRVAPEAPQRLTPGAIIPKAPGSAGLTPLAAPGNFDISQLVLSDLRARIRAKSAPSRMPDEETISSDGSSSSTISSSSIAAASGGKRTNAAQAALMQALGAVIEDETLESREQWI